MNCLLEKKSIIRFLWSRSSSFHACSHFLFIEVKFDYNNVLVAWFRCLYGTALTNYNIVSKMSSPQKLQFFQELKQDHSMWTYGVPGLQDSMQSLASPSSKSLESAKMVDSAPYHNYKDKNKYIIIRISRQIIIYSLRKTKGECHYILDKFSQIST